MTEYKLYYNDEELEIYGNLKIGSKKLKQNDWFAMEPQRISLDLYKYSLPVNAQQSLSNELLFNIFDRDDIAISGIIPDIYISIYEDAVLIYGGFVSLLESKYDKIYGKASIICYDALKSLGILSDEDVRIINNTIEFTNFMSFLQTKIVEAGFTNITINNIANLPSYVFDEQSVDTGKDNDIVTPIEDYPLSGLYYTSGTDNDILYFYYITADYRPPSQSSGHVFSYISYQMILMSFDGLKYSRLINDSGTIDIDDNDIFSYGNKVIELRNKFESDVKKFWKSFTYFMVFQGFTFQEYTAFDIDYKIETNYINAGDIVVTMNGNLFTPRRSFGGYIIDGYWYENDSSIIDVLKMYLMSNDYICFADGLNIKVISYNQYSASIVLDDDEVMSIKQSYQTKNIIEEIPAIESNQGIWLKILNRYYSDNINSKFYSIRLNGVGRRVRAGDRITNSTYNINLFIFQINYKVIDDNTITVTGVNA